MPTTGSGPRLLDGRTTVGAVLWEGAIRSAALQRGLILRANCGEGGTGRVSGAALAPPTLDVAGKLHVPIGPPVTLVTSGE